MPELINTTAEIKAYVAIDAQTQIESITPFIKEATSIFMNDLLGDAFLTALTAEYNADTLTAANTTLLPYVQRPLAYYALYLACDQLSVNFGDAGITESRDQTTGPAPKYKTDALKLHYLTQGDVHAEFLLKFLEENSADYAVWTSSAANTAADGLILPTAKLADEHIDINESRRIFKRIKKRARKIETGLIKRLVGAEQYDLLVTNIKAATLTDEQNDLINLLRPIIAKKALYETLPSLKLSITNDGLTIFSYSDGTVSKAAASREEVKALAWSLKDSETGYEADMQELKQFIIDNIADYPLIEASTAYTSRPDPGPRRPPENLPTNKHFSV